MLPKNLFGPTIAVLGIVILSVTVCSVKGEEYVVKYPDPPEGKPYKTEIREETNVAMEGWYNAMKVFVKTVQPNKPPVETFYKYVTGKEQFTIPDSLNQILKLEKGFVACLIFGLLFIIIMPIVGLFFCACRLCGNCGGKLVQAQNDNLDCRRRTYFLLLISTFFFLIISVIAMYACNENIGKAVPVTHKTVIDNIDDTQLFINNTYTELIFIVEDSLDTAINGLFFTLDNINNTLGIDVRDALNRTYDVEEVFDMSYYVAANAQPIAEDIIKMVKDSELIEGNFTEKLGPIVSKISDELKSFKGNCKDLKIKAIENLCAYPVFFLNYTDAFNDFTGNIKTHLDEVQKVLDENLDSYVTIAVNEFQSIPYHVEDNTVSLRNDIKDTINTIRKEIRSSPELVQLKDVKSTVVSTTDEAKNQINNVMGTVEKYDNIRWYVGFFVCLIVAICVGLIFLGMCCGLFGHKAGALPTQRSMVSNAGGISLMAAVGFIFLFASLLMIITTGTFLIGAHGEAFICDILYNDIPLLDKIKDVATDDLINEPFIKDIKLSEVLSECKANEPAYTALGLKKYFNISEIKDLVDREKINEEIETLKDKVNLRNISFVPKDLQSLLETYTEGVNINFTDYIDTLKHSVLKSDISEYVNQLEDAVKNIKLTDIPEDVRSIFKKALDKLIKNIEVIKENLYEILPGISALQETLLAFVTKNQEKLEKFHIDLQFILGHLLDLKQKVISGIFDVVKQPIYKYKDSLLDQVDNYVDYLETQATEKVAKCEPLWKVYDSVRFVVCKLFLDPFNGFWFALGWCLAFFIPALIFSIKLSRHYRKMQYTEFEGTEADCDKYGTKRDNSWEYGVREDEQESWSHRELQPIYAYDNQNFESDYHPSQNYKRQNGHKNS